MGNPKIKLCGITRKEDYQASVELKLDYVGFIFVPGTPRCVDSSSVLFITDSVPVGSLPKRVGVFADESIRTIKEIYQAAKLDMVQLHGSESPSYCRELKLPFWKMLSSTDRVSEYAMINNSPVLLDARGAYERESSSGELDCAEAEKAIASGVQIILAGGISISNVNSLVKLKPWCIDFCSSVETSPGIKNHQLLRELVDKIRGN